MSSDNSLVQQRLELQQNNLGELLNILEEEKAILGKTEPESLNRIIETKEAKLKEILSLDEVLASSPQLKEDKANGLYKELFSSIDDLLTQCKQLNNVNGAVIAHSQQTINRMRTSVLERRGKASMTYDEKGKTSTGIRGLDLKA